jgi:hypothetical protein
MKFTARCISFSCFCLSFIFALTSCRTRSFNVAQNSGVELKSGASTIQLSADLSSIFLGCDASDRMTIAPRSEFVAHFAKEKEALVERIRLDRATLQQAELSKTIEKMTVEILTADLENLENKLKFYESNLKTLDELLLHPGCVNLTAATVKAKFQPGFAEILESLNRLVTTQKPKASPETSDSKGALAIQRPQYIQESLVLLTTDAPLLMNLQTVDRPQFVLHVRPLTDLTPLASSHGFIFQGGESKLTKAVGSYCQLMKVKIEAGINVVSIPTIYHLDYTIVNDNILSANEDWEESLKFEHFKKIGKYTASFQKYGALVPNSFENRMTDVFVDEGIVASLIKSGKAKKLVNKLPHFAKEAEKSSRATSGKFAEAFAIILACESGMSKDKINSGLSVKSLMDIFPDTEFEVRLWDSTRSVFIE